MIDFRTVEERFGIRVALNSISPEKIYSIDRQTFDASPRLSRTQTIKASAVSDYFINPEQDLLRALAGETKASYKNALGAVIAGIDSLKTSVAIDLKEIKELLNVALERSESADYLKPDSLGNNSEFAWVENLLPVRDKGLINSLDENVWKKIIQDDHTEMWMAIPEILDWSEVEGFKYRATADGELHSNLSLTEFVKTFRKDTTLNTFKQRVIYMAMSKGHPVKTFNAYRCLYSELRLGKDFYILNDGSWYKVEANFQKAVEKYFSSIPKTTLSPPFLEYSHEGEGGYNEDVCAQAKGTHAMLDRKLIQFGGKYDKIEICDIFQIADSSKKQGMQFIHVKRGRSSATLSHLFAQGLVASTLLVKEQEFRKSVNKQFASANFPELPLNFSGAGSEVIFAIIDGVAGMPLDIPFFSKVTLQNCGKTISAFGYKLGIMHIPESAAHIAKKKADKAAASAP